MVGAVHGALISGAALIGMWGFHTFPLSGTTETKLWLYLAPCTLALFSLVFGIIKHSQGAMRAVLVLAFPYVLLVAFLGLFPAARIE
jgi:hypothetical protein